MNERLYNLFPLLYREKDLAQGQPLRALASVLETGYDTIYEDIERLYENWFIELCNERFIPQIAAQVGIEDLNASHLLQSERRYVANYLGYKRRLGIESTLNNALQDSTGYKYITRDAYQTMALTWSAADPSLQGLTYFLSDQAIPIAKSSRTADFKTSYQHTLQTDNGKLNVNSVHLYAWRLSALPVDKAQLAPIPGQEGCYHLNPFGFDLKLADKGERLDDVECLNENYLADHEYNRVAQPNQQTHINTLKQKSNKGLDKKSVTFYLFDELAQRYQCVPDEKIIIADLKNWHSSVQLKSLIAFDPLNGRVKVLQSKYFGKLFASYSYYSNTVFGAGPYYFNVELPCPQQIFVSRDVTFKDSVKTVSEATTQWQESGATIIITDNLIYQDDIQLDLRGRDLNMLAGNNVQPLYQGHITLTNSANEVAHVTIKGLNIKGSITLGDNIHLSFDKTTIVNNADTLCSLNDNTTNQQIDITNSLVTHFNTLRNALIKVKNSVLQTSLVQHLEGNLTLDTTTVFGDLYCGKADLIKDTIINGVLKMKDSNQLNLTHSYIAEFKVPLNCQPEQLIIGSAFEHKILHFNSSSIQRHNFATLSHFSAKEILLGATNGEEMGVFNGYKFRLREKKLQQRIDKFLPYGLDIQLNYMD